MVGQSSNHATAGSHHETQEPGSILPKLGIPSDLAAPITPSAEEPQTLQQGTIENTPSQSNNPPKPQDRGKAVARPDAEQDFDEKHPPEDDSVADMQPDIAGGDDARSEIQDIMDQFSVQGDAMDEEEIMSPIRKRASFFSSKGSIRSISPSLYRPTSRDSTGTGFGRTRSIAEGVPPPPPPDSEKPDSATPQSPTASAIFQPRPPSPDPEPAQAFDFHRFLEQLRHRTADPVARFLRSFLNEFGKKQWMVHEQVKIISDFLEFIAKKMSQCEVWRTVSEAEFDNAKEGMEKLVMNRLYTQTFSPVIPANETPLPPKSRRLRSNQEPSGPGRRGQHQEDVERDQVIAQKLRIYGWIREEHLDIPPLDEKGRKFLSLAQQELLKINSYRAPRDKVIQILNCCKVIFGFLKNNKTDQSADSFIPLLIFTVLRANPPHLASNVQYILRFRNQDKLGGEAGYYISSLSGVISFIEGLDRTNLTITDEEFERNVEVAVSSIAEGHRQEEYEARTSNPSPLSTIQTATITSPLTPSPLISTPRTSTDTAPTSPRRTASRRFPSDTKTSPTSAPSDDLATGILRSIQRPLSNIGRMFSDNDSTSGSGSATPTQTLPVRTSSLEQPRTADGEVMRFFAGNRRQPSARDLRDPEEQARQASHADAEAQRVRSEEHRVVVETLQGMFPDLDRDVISDVVRMKEGRVGMAVDACLALST